MKNNFPTTAKVIVIGGGVAGCSVAYHLAKYGWKDIVLLERDQLTSGTTWHAAGLVGQLGASATITKFRKYSLDLYKKLEKETELSTGLKQNGAITVATTESRLEELKRQATTAQLFDVEANILNPSELKKLYPIMNTNDIIGGVHIPLDGQADPVGVTNVLAKAAKMQGAKIYEKCPVKKIIVQKNKIVGVETEQGKIDCEYIVLATGMWSRQIAAEINVSIPLYPDEHFYILTEPVQGIDHSLPVLRDYNHCLYIKEDAGKLLVGIFEPNAKPAFNQTNQVPNDFSFGELPGDFDHFEPYLMHAIKRIPALKQVGIRKFFCGPESFTPDTNYLLGETPEVKNFFVCCGFNSIGLVSAGGAGHATAKWIIDKDTNEDLFSLDISRFEKFHSETKFITERVTETLGDLYDMHWPYKQHVTSRNQITLPYHDNLKKAGACFGVGGGFERPMWYALNNEPKYQYSFGYQNWYESAKFETTNARKHVAFFELSPFSKFEIKGPNAHAALQNLCANNIKEIVGATTYTQMLNPNGGIEADLTVTCLEKNIFRVISGAAVRTHDKKHILSNLKYSIEFNDITEKFACFGIFGPKSRKLLTELFGNEFKTSQFPFGSGKYLIFQGVTIWFQRLSYVGELGWELYIPMKNAKMIYNIIIEAGNNHQLVHAGAHAMDIMRMEKKYLHWGHDISPEENPYEANLGFAVCLKKEHDFIGKVALKKINQMKPAKKLIMLTLDDSKPGLPLLIHDEPIYLDGKIVGETTSGNFSFNYNKNMSLGYIDLSKVNENFQKQKFQIEVAKNKYNTTIQQLPLHDPDNILIKN